MSRRKFHWRGVSGYTSPAGIKFVQVENKNLSVFVPLTAFVLEVQEAKQTLAEAGLVPIGGAWNELCEDVAALTEFPDRRIADRSGWNGDIFAFPDGAIIAPEGAEAPALAMKPDRSRCALAGSTEGWVDNVGTLLANQAIPMATVLMGYASPLVEVVGRFENFGFELVGPGGIGKTTVLRSAVSTYSGPNLPSFNTTSAGLESEMHTSNGQLLVLDEANSFYGTETPSKRGAAMKGLAFDLAIGKPKRRYLSPTPQRSSFVFLTSSNQALADLAGGESRHVLRAASDRLMTLRVSAERPFGVFDSVPPSFSTAEEYAKALEAACKANHGHPMRAYVQGLVNDLARDRDEVVERVQANVRLWRQRAGADLGGDGAIGRVADAFGLLYAASVEAKRHLMLPEGWRCGAALKEVYEHIYTGPKAIRPIDDDLRSHLRQPGVRDLDVQGMRRMSDALVDATPGFLKSVQNGEVEARLPPANVARSLPDLIARLPSSRAGVRLNAEAGRTTNKRQVRSLHGPERIIVLTLPPGFLQAPL